MAKTALNIIKNWFKTGLFPTQDQFWNTWDSFWHKDDGIPQDAIDGLQDALDAKADKANSGLVRMGDYMVDRRGGLNTTIKAGNVIYGIGSFFNGEYVIAEALQDDPSTDAHFSIKYQS